MEHVKLCQCEQTYITDCQPQRRGASFSIDTVLWKQAYKSTVLPRVQQSREHLRVCRSCSHLQGKNMSHDTWDVTEITTTYCCPVTSQQVQPCNPCRWQVVYWYVCHSHTCSRANNAMTMAVSSPLNDFWYALVDLGQLLHYDLLCTFAKP